MDEATQQALEARVLEVLRANPQGLRVGVLLTVIDEIETPAELVTLLGAMKRKQLVFKETTNDHWCAVLGVSPEQQLREQRADAAAAAKEPPPLHPCAAAVLQVLADAAGKRVRLKQMHEAITEFNEAVIGYHVKELRAKGLIKPGAKPSDGYALGKTAGALPAARRVDKPRPNTAPVSERAKAKEPPPSAIPPPAPTVATQPPAKPAHDITVALTCPNGHLTVAGTPKLVFGFLAQMEAMAA